MNFPLGLPSLPLPHPDVSGRGRVTLWSEESRINGETHTGCVYFIMRMLLPKTFALAMTSSRLLPVWGWNSGLVQFSHSGFICRSHCIFYHLNFSGLLRQHRGEGIGKIRVCGSLMSWGYRLWEFPFSNSAINLWSLRLLKPKPPKLLEMSIGVNSSLSFW